MTDKTLATYEGQQEIAEAIRGINIEALTQKAVWVDSVADMRELDAPQGITVATRGYYEPNDGGNGFYYIHAKEVGAVDDGGSVIFLDNDNEAKLITDGTVNVKQFGAVGDGTTDDTTAIQNCFDCDISVVNLQESTYKIGEVTISKPKTITDGTLYIPATDSVQTMLTVTKKITLRNVNFTTDHNQLPAESSTPAHNVIAYTIYSSDHPSATANFSNVIFIYLSNDDAEAEIDARDCAFEHSFIDISCYCNKSNILQNCKSTDSIFFYQVSDRGADGSKVLDCEAESSEYVNSTGHRLYFRGHQHNYYVERCKFVSKSQDWTIQFTGSDIDGQVTDDNLLGNLYIKDCQFVLSTYGYAIYANGKRNVYADGCRFINTNDSVTQGFFYHNSNSKNYYTDCVFDMAKSNFVVNARSANITYECLNCKINVSHLSNSTSYTTNLTISNSQITTNRTGTIVGSKGNVYLYNNEVISNQALGSNQAMQIDGTGELIGNYFYNANAVSRLVYNTSTTEYVRVANNVLQNYTDVERPANNAYIIKADNTILS